MTVAAPPARPSATSRQIAHRPLVERGDSAADRVDEMRFDPLDGRRVEIVMAQSIGVAARRSASAWRAISKLRIPRRSLGASPQRPKAAMRR